MAEILLARHCKAFVNVNDLAFGNKESPLTTEGMMQAVEQRQVSRSDYGIVPEEYSERVLCSEFVRPYQTAIIAGFDPEFIDRDPILNEANVEKLSMNGVAVLLKHARENWALDNALRDAEVFLDRVRDGYYSHKIYYTHAMKIASICMVHGDPGIEFDPKRGYAPLQGGIVRLIV